MKAFDDSAIKARQWDFPAKRDSDHLRSMAARRDAQGRREDAHFLRLMALYFERVIERPRESHYISGSQ